MFSIWEDGYTMPCVCYYRPDRDEYELVDGYHRYLVLKTSKRIYEREKGMLPVTVIEKDISNRMASTIRHNRARGTHSVELMSHIVSELTKAGMSDQWILRNIGMDRDELLRLKQISGLAELFADKEISACLKNNPCQKESWRDISGCGGNRLEGTTSMARHTDTVVPIERFLPKEFEKARQSCQEPFGWDITTPGYKEKRRTPRCDSGLLSVLFTLLS